MQDKKKIDALVTKIANGTGGHRSRAVSNAPPRPAKAVKRKAAAPNPPTPNENTVVGSDTNIPAPKKSRGGSPINIIVNLGKEYC